MGSMQGNRLTWNTGRQGFTLIEILIVIAIIAILASILIPNFVHARAQSVLTACRSNLRNIGAAMEMYATDNSGRYVTSLASLTPNYLKSIPTCPSVGSATYASGLVSVSSPDAYTVCCAGSNHGAVDEQPNYPQYASGQGLIDNTHPPPPAATS